MHNWKNSQRHQKKSESMGMQSNMLAAGATSRLDKINDDAGIQVDALQSHALRSSSIPASIASGDLVPGLEISGLRCSNSSAMNSESSAIEGLNRAGNPGDIIPDSCITGVAFLSRGEIPAFLEPCPQTGDSPFCAAVAQAVEERFAKPGFVSKCPAR
ncbi:MAG: hypothetical protein K2P57_08955 [Burkholderiales bacterium]|nr:hypothetical protein [Burkholderiales bacterium]